MDDLGAIVAVDAGTSVEVLDVTDAVLDPASLTPKFLLPRIVIARVGGLEKKRKHYFLKKIENISSKKFTDKLFPLFQA